jgi:DNA-binding beta-propeller fold protein YncE
MTRFRLLTTQNRLRPAYTIAELMALMAVVAIGVALVVEVKRSFVPQYIQSVSLTADGSRAIAALNDGSVLAWDTTTGEQFSLLGPQDDYVAHVAVSPDGQVVARNQFRPQSQLQGSQGVLQITDLKTSKNTNCGPISFTGTFPGALAFSATGERLAIVDPAGNRLRIISPHDPTAQEVVLSPLDPAVSGSSGGAMPYTVACTAVSQDGRKVYIATYYGQLDKWDVETGQATRISTSSIPSGFAAALSLVISPDGRQIAVVTCDPTASTGQYSIEIYDTGSLSLLRRATSSEQLLSAAFCNSGRSLAVLGNDLEIWDADTLQERRKIPLDNYMRELASSADGSQLALSDGRSIYLLEGNQLRKLGSIGSSGGSLLYLIFAFVFAFGAWRVMRKRRMMKTCVDCGKKWQAVKRGPGARFVQCPDCRLEHLPTDELRKRLGGQSRRELRVWISVLVLLAVVSTWGNGLSNGNVWEIAWFAVRSLLGWAAVFVLLFVLILVAVVAWRRARLRQFGKADYALRAAQKAAAREGRSEQIGAMMVWTDSPEAHPHPDPLPRGEGAKHNLPAGEGAFSIPSADVLAEQLDDCRRRLEELLGVPCAPMPASQKFIFATTAAAQKFMPVRGLTHEMPAVFCGPWANVGCISLEGLRKQLRPLLPSIRALMSYQWAPWPRYGFWLGYATHNHVARTIDQTEIDACRRRIAVWAAEGSLLPQKEICRRRIVSVATSGAKSSLPENYNRSLRITNQWLSLADYFCGVDATPERREQFQRLWQAAGRVRKLFVALEEACGCRLSEFETQWKTWAATASFGPPTVSPVEIAEAARNEIIPLVRNTAAPIQRRIKAMRILGNCGWTIGAEVLLEMFACPQPDLQREALASLRLLSGRLGTERADDWQSWLASLPTAAKASVWPMSPEDKFGLKTVS